VPQGCIGLLSWSMFLTKTLSAQIFSSTELLLQPGDLFCVCSVKGLTDENSRLIRESKLARERSASVTTLHLPLASESCILSKLQESSFSMCFAHAICVPHLWEVVHNASACSLAWTAHNFVRLHFVDKALP